MKQPLFSKHNSWENGQDVTETQYAFSVDVFTDTSKCDDSN